ncbi:MAG: signal peptidase I [bacterium]|nr:signal peptidase I [bacterium]
METLKKIWQFIYETGKTILVSLAVVLVVRSFIVQPFYVRGASMEPNFEDGEYLIINEIVYTCVKSHCAGMPERGDVIVFRYPLDPSEYFIKRVIGLPGDTIDIDAGTITVNGKELEEPYLDPYLETYGKVHISLGSDEFYVLGDNRSASSDSRRWGVLNRRNIVGKVWLRGWPPDRVGVISDEDPILR